jgi:phosphatidylglycerol:prolipoprotein diacylglycerol transferase
VRALGGPGNENLFHLTRPLHVPLHTYGLLIATAFIVAMWLAGRAARRAGLDQDRVMDLCFWILVSSMIGSRVLFILVNWDDYARHPAAILAFWQGGLVFYGGFLGAVAGSIWYMRRHKMQFFPYADALIPSVAIGHAIGRLGCFAAGCCWGGACDPHFALGARFPPESLAYQSQLANHVIHSGALHTIAIHPTQLYESLGELCIFLFLTAWRSRKRFNGELLALYLVLYAPLRATVETLRGDEERGRVFNFVGPWARGAWWNLSTSELISVGIFCTGVALFLLLSRRGAPQGAAAA